MLLGGDPFFLKIPDHANADGIGIVSFALHVAAFDLAEPTIAHFHFAIDGDIGAVAKDEMISEANLHSAPTMRGIKNLRVAIARGAGVGDDIFPLGGVNAWLVDRGERQRSILHAQMNALTGDDEILGETVPEFKLGDGNAVALGNGTEGITLRYHVIAAQYRRQCIDWI